MELVFPAGGGFNMPWPNVTLGINIFFTRKEINACLGGPQQLSRLEAHRNFEYRQNATPKVGFYYPNQGHGNSY